MKFTEAKGFWICELTSSPKALKLPTLTSQLSVIYKVRLSCPWPKFWSIAIWLSTTVYHDSHVRIISRQPYQMFTGSIVSVQFYLRYFSILHFSICIFLCHKVAKKKNILSLPKLPILFTLDSIYFQLSCRKMDRQTDRQTESIAIPWLHRVDVGYNSERSLGVSPWQRQPTSLRSNSTATSSSS